MKALLLAVVAAALLAGCVTSKMVSVASPDAQPFSSVMIWPINLDLGSRVVFEEEFCKQIAPTKCMQSLHWVSATEDMNSAVEKISNSEAEGLLLVELASDDTSTTYVGTMNDQTTTTYGNAQAQVYGNSAYVSGSSTSTTSGTSIPIYTFRRSARSTVVLMDGRKDTKVPAWQGQLDTKAYDAFGGDDESMARETASRLAKEIRLKGLLR